MFNRLDYKFSIKKARFRIREACPVLGLLTLFLIGQLAGHFAYVLNLSQFATVGLGITTLFLSKYRVKLLVILAGILSILSTYPQLIDLKGFSEESFFGKVISEPRFRRPGEIEILIEVYAYKDFDGTKIFLKNNKFKSLCKGVDLPWKNLTGVSPNSDLVFTANFKTLSPEISPFSYTNTLLRKGISSTCKIRLSTKPQLRSAELVYTLRTKLRNLITSSLGNNERAGLLMSMAFGIRDTLSSQTEEVFRRTGLAHLLVVSGYQVSIFFIASVFICGSLLLRMQLAFNSGYAKLISYGLSLISGFCFVALVGFDDSALRALVGLVLYVFAVICEKGQKKYQLLAASALVMVVFWPGCWLGPSFQLTYAALVGIYLGMRKGSEFSFSSYLTANILASFFTAIVSGFWFSQVSFLGLILNPLFGSLASFISCKIGILALCLNLFGLDPDAYGLKLVSYF
ncbi:MAG: ComEC/Rec2 family competence protein [Bdellovibrionota bacterium]